MNKTISFNKKINELTNGEYTPIGEYVNVNTHIKMRHNCKECNNHEWMVKPKKFVSDGTRCPVCSRLKRPKKVFDKDTQEKIIAMYLDKNSIKNIAKSIHSTSKKVSMFLHESGIEVNGKLIYQKYTDSFILEIAEEYIPGENMHYLAEKYDINITTLLYRFKQLGIETTKRSYGLNENYFKEIDNQNKAYILGFLMADGCVSKSDRTQLSANRLTISISHKDRYLLEFIKKELECEYEIIDFIPSGTYANNEMSRLQINSKKICSDLAKYGIVPRKTGLERMPELDHEMKRHFIRGFLDGDGYITRGGKTIGFCSSESMLNDILNTFKSEYEIESVATIKKDNRDKPLYYMALSCSKDIENIKNYLYKDANFYLKRKFSKLT